MEKGKRTRRVRPDRFRGEMQALQESVSSGRFRLWSGERGTKVGKTEEEKPRKNLRNRKRAWRL